MGWDKLNKWGQMTLFKMTQPTLADHRIPLAAPEGMNLGTGLSV